MRRIARVRWAGQLLLFGCLTLGCQAPPAISPDEPREPATDPARPFPEAELDAFAQAVRSALAGEQVDLGALPAMLRAPSRPIAVILQADGEFLSSGYISSSEGVGPMQWHMLSAALAQAQAGLGPDDMARVSSIVISLSGEATNYAMSDPQQWQDFLDADAAGVPRHLGVRGDVIIVDEAHGSVRTPINAITRNKPLHAHLSMLHDRWQLSDDEWQRAFYATFEATQIFVTLEPLAATQMFRGNLLVDLAMVDQTSTEQLGARAAEWLIRNIDEHGRLINGYSPSQYRERFSANAIRQWDATMALLRWAERREDPALFALVARNIEQNLTATFRIDREFGLVGFDSEKEKQGKLGAIAIAARVLHRHPERARWAKQADALGKTIDYLAHGDGRFDMFYRGDDDDRSLWNFYPGEALLFWAERYAELPNPELLNKYRRSFEFYRAWYRDPSNGKAAFVPWHLHANTIMLDALNGTEPKLEDELRSFCFELADALVTIQQWDGDPIHPDEWGRYYSPDQPTGPPHASSTGIYTWSLVDALRLARAAGDSVRAERYRLAILRGLRSLMQLQFVDEVDMFYVPQAERVYVEGGLRTNVYDNDIRVDNVGYALLAAVAVLETFDERDYGSGK